MVKLPSWSVHLAVAKEINKTLKLDKDLFYFGNLIADINYGNKLTRKDTHYNKSFKCKKCITETLPDIKLFLKDYKDKLYDPLIMGYFCHILTDYYYNNYVFSNCWVQENNKVVGIKLKSGRIIKTDNKDKTLRKDLKHYDFDLYGKYLFNKGDVVIPNIDYDISNSLSLLKSNYFTNDLVVKRMNYLNNEFYKFNKISLKEKIIGYKLFTKEELDQIFNDCNNFILKEIDKLKIRDN